MHSTRPRARTFRKVAAFLVLAAMVALGQPAGPAHAGEQVNGSGSTWSAIAVQVWQADVARQGLWINFNANGSSTGRQFYIEGTSDFAVSEIPFQHQTKDRFGNIVYDEIARAARRPYAYLPIVAGGTSFMYHLTVNGQMIRDLRLSGATIAKIFTGAIKNWNDPAIAADDGRHFPAEQIKPVLRSDGSGTSAQFTAYLNNQFPSIWQPFCKTTHLTPCETNSYFPYFAGSQAQQGSDGVASAVAAPYNEGAITYVEYGYAKQRNFPVVSVKNAAGYFVQPTAGNVAVALTAARINPDRTQVLGGVYTNPDKRTYPVSSYSYMIVPTSTVKPFTAGKGSTLGKFILYFLCTGQQKAEVLGYSPLPKNLVEFGFDAVRRIPGAPAPPPISQCADPAIDPSRVPPPPANAAPGAVRQNPTGGAGGGGTQVAGGRIGGSAPAGGATGNGSSATNTGSSSSPQGVGSSTKTGSNSTGTSPSASKKLKSSTAAKRTGATNAAGTGTAADTGVPGADTALATTAAIRSKDDRVPLPVYGTVGFVVLLAVFGPPALNIGLRRRIAARQRR